MTSKLTLLLGIAGWALAVYGVLAFGTLDVDLGHGLCGPWGCAPPLPAVASMHAFWGLMLLPPAALAIKKLPSHPLRLLGKSLVAASAAALVAVAVYQAISWGANVPAEAQRYLPQRILFVLVTLTDAPLVQVGLAGLACWVAALCSVRRGSTEPQRSGEGTPADSAHAAVPGR